MNTKDRILETSLQLFNKHGITAITTNHIADEIGISPGSLYYHFSNKEEIVRALFQQMIDCLDQSFRFDKGQELELTALVDFLGSNFKLMLDYPLFAREFSTLIQRDKELRKIFNKMKQKRYEEIEYILRKLVVLGIMNQPENGVTILSLVEMIWVVSFFWTTHLAVTDQPLNQQTIDKGIEMVLNLLRPYLVKPK